MSNQILSRTINKNSTGTKVSAMVLIAWVGALGVLTTACSSGPKKVSVLPTTDKVVRMPVVSMDVTQASQSLCPKIGADLSKKKLKELIQAGNSCIRNQDYARLEEVGIQTNRKEPFQPWGSFFLSVAADARGELQRAKWMIDLALKKNQSYGILHFQKARLLWNEQRFGEAIQLVKKSVDMDPGLTEGHLFLGQIYFRDQEFEPASEHFYTVLKAKPSHPMALTGLAESRMYRGDYRGAMEVLNRAVNYHPDMLEFQLRQAQIYETGLSDKVNALNTYIQIKRRLMRSPSRVVSLADIETKIQQIESSQRQPAVTSPVAKGGKQ